MNKKPTIEEIQKALLKLKNQNITDIYIDNRIVKKDLQKIIFYLREEIKKDYDELVKEYEDLRAKIELISNKKRKLKEDILQERYLVGFQDALATAIVLVSNNLISKISKD